MNVIVIGPKGKMGRLITQIAAEREDMKLVGGVGPAGRDYIGQDLGSVAGVGYPLNVSVVDQLEEIIDTCDVLIDFSTKEMALEVLQKAVDHKKAFVCGTKLLPRGNAEISGSQSADSGSVCSQHFKAGECYESFAENRSCCDWQRNRH